MLGIIGTVQLFPRKIPVTFLMNRFPCRRSHQTSVEFLHQTSLELLSFQFELEYRF